MDKVVILARVSTDRQEYQRQVNELTDYCNRVGWNVEATFCNKVSGAKTIVCLEISRLGRNTLEALRVIQTLNEHGVSLYVKNYNLETLNPDGKVNPVTSLICTILLEIASMERLTIKERMASGRDQYIAKCRKEGIKMGRPSNYKKSEDSYRQQYSKEISLLHKGISLRNTSAITGTSINTLRKIKDLF